MIDLDFPKGVHDFHRDVEFRGEQPLQPLRPGRTPGDVDIVEGLCRRCLAKEIKGLLDLEQQDLGYRAEVLGERLRLLGGTGFTRFELLRVVKTKVELLLQRVRVLIAAHRNVAGK